MFARFDDYSNDLFIAMKQSDKENTPAIATTAALSFVDYTTVDHTKEPKCAIPSTKWIGKTNCQGDTGLYSTTRKVQRIFVNKEIKLKWRLSELS